MKGLLPHRLEQRPAGFDDVRRAAGDDEELGRGRGFRPTEDRSRDEALPSIRVRRREPLRQRDADRAHGDVDRALAQRADHAVVAEHDRLDAGVVRQHRDDGVAAAGVSHPRRGARALLHEGPRPARGTIVDRHPVAGAKEVRRHAGAHVPEADESDVHDVVPSSAVVLASGVPPVWHVCRRIDRDEPTVAADLCRLDARRSASLTRRAPRLADGTAPRGGESAFGRYVDKLA